MNAKTEITDPEAILGIKKTINNITVNNKMHHLEDNKFIKCSFCEHQVSALFLTKHIGLHIENQLLEKTTNTAHTNVKKQVTVVKDVFEKINVEDLKRFLNALPLSKVKDISEFSFRKIKDMSVSSSVSKNGRYSDLMLVINVDGPAVTYNGGYVGSSSSHASSAQDKLKINLVYDNVENYFTVSGKIYRKNSYSSIEYKEASIPDRICEQYELADEVRKTLLFFRISPKIVYKRFIKIMNKDFVFTGDNRLSVETENHSTNDSLSKSKSYCYEQQGDCHGMYGM